MSMLQQQAQEFFVIGDGNPYALDWVPLKNLLRGQASLYDAGPITGYSWWNFTVYVFGEVFGPDFASLSSEELEALQTSVRNSGQNTSMLKVEVEYPLGNGKLRRFRMDVGSGVDIFIPPTHKVFARILGPDPSSIPSELPAGFNRNTDVASLIVVSARCVPAPIGVSWATDTQLVATDASQSVYVPIQPGAKKAQVQLDGVPSRREQVMRRFDSAGLLIDSVNTGDIPLPYAASPSSSIFELAGPTTDIFLFGGGATLISGSVVQILEF